MRYQFHNGRQIKLMINFSKHAGMVTQEKKTSRHNKENNDHENWFLILYHLKRKYSF